MLHKVDKINKIHNDVDLVTLFDFILEKNVNKYPIKNMNPIR